MEDHMIKNKNESRAQSRGRVILRGYFSRFELILWSASLLTVTVPFFVFDRSNWLSLFASLIGLAMLAFNAKGNPLGQAFAIAFSVLYGIISYSQAYYGEMLTYMCMTMPMAVFSLITWLRNPSENKRSEVEINHVKRAELAFLALLSAFVTAVFYFVLEGLGTANIWVSTFSVTTSFAAVYLTMRRSEYFAIAYALNDIVLLVLWTLAAVNDISYISVISCFVAFLANDIYTFVSWQRLKKKQRSCGNGVT